MVSETSAYHKIRDKDVCQGLPWILEIPTRMGSQEFSTKVLLGITCFVKPARVNLSEILYLLRHSFLFLELGQLSFG